MTPYYEDEVVTLYHGNCCELLHRLPECTTLLTDPPYGITKGAAVVRYNTTEVQDWGDVGHNSEVVGWRELVAFHSEGAWVAEFGAMHANAFLTAAHTAAGWAPSNVYALVKQAPPPTPRPGFVSAVELGLVSRVGKPKWHGSGYTPNRWIGLTPNRDGTSTGHPTQKPLPPFAALVRALCPADGLVLDPFAGSGTTLRAAKDEGRRAIGIELEERYCELAANRLTQDTLFAGL